ncbi:MAG: flagellar protein G [Candidatus Methanoperedens sp.]|nr:flagellar protein G [Candidatus Methanoperedens sp.]
MGAGASATQMVFFIASLIIALSVVGALFMNVQSLSSAVIIGSKTLTEQLRTDITVINDPEIIPNSSVIYTFYVKNTGVQELDTKYINVIIDGTIIHDNDLNKTIIDGSQTWLTGDVLMINATVSLQAGNHNLRVITSNGIEDTFPFRTT